MLWSSPLISKTGIFFARANFARSFPLPSCNIISTINRAGFRFSKISAPVESSFAMATRCCISSRKVQSTLHTSASSSTTKISGCGAADIWLSEAQKRPPIKDDGLSSNLLATLHTGVTRPALSDHVQPASLHKSRVLVFDRAIALAGGFFEPFPIEHGDPTLPVADETGVLQRASCDRHSCAAYAKHHAEEFVGQRQVVAADAIMRCQKPACATLINRMPGVAGSTLRDMEGECLRKAQEAQPQGPALLHAVEQGASRNT